MTNIQQSIEAWLCKGRPLTVKMAWNLFHTSELRVYISRISKAHTINSRWCEHNGHRFKTYQMPVGTRHASAKSR